VQLALAQALDLHAVHSELEVTSYEEGWGLYAERLAGASTCSPWTRRFDIRQFTTWSSAEA
jgi:hypothetical protein